MRKLRSSAPQPSAPRLGKRDKLAGGYEHIYVPSLLARRALFHVVTLGESTCPPGFRFGHPNPRGGFVDDRGVILHFIRSGQLTHRVNGQLHVAQRGQAALLDLRRPVEYCNDSAQPVRLWWVWFDGVGLAEVVSELGVELDPIFSRLNKRTMNLLYGRLATTVEREAAGHEVDAAALLTAMLAELVYERPPRHAFGKGKLPVSLSPEIREAVKWIASFYRKQWAIKQLSHEVGLSPSYFFRRFFRETGHTPIEYLNRYRIEQAKMLLTSTRLPVEEIARQVGIPNRKHFAKVFHQVTQTSPREFRAKAQGARSGRRLT